MPSNIEDFQAGNVRYYGPLHGVVIDNADPDGLHRIRAQVPGITDETRWAWPRTSGGGSPQRGGHIVPHVGADVIIEFIGGDPNGKVLYSAAWWGVPDAGSEMPDDVRNVPATEAANVQSLQFDRLRFTVNENEGKRSFTIVDSRTGDALVWDLERGVIMLSATSGIILKADGIIRIEATQVTVNDRPVLVDTRPI